MEVKGKTLEGNFSRSIRLDSKGIDTESRSVELSFSSEEPYERWFGKEVLGHGEKEADLSRLNDGHPLLLQHNETQQIGVVEKAWVGEDRKGRARVRFAPESNKLAEMVYQDVKAGIRSRISVGYKVNEFRKEEELDEKAQAKKETVVYRAVSWCPFEISVVSIPADNTVAIGKSMEPEPKPEPAKVEVIAEPPPKNERNYMPDEKDKERLELEEKAARERAANEARLREERKDLVEKQERQRMQEIYEVARRFKAEDLRDTAIKENWSADKFRREVMERIEPGTIERFDVDQKPDGSKSVGQLFIESPQYREMAGKFKDQRGSIILTTDDRSGFYGVRDNPFSAAGQSLTSETILPGVPGILDQQQLRVSQIFPQSMTNSRVIRFIKESSFTNPITGGVAESGTKTAATLAVEEATATVYKIAVYTKTTSEMMEDHSEMRGFIDGRLSYMVQAHEDENLLNGSASAATNEITGIFETSGINSIAASTYTTVADAFGQALNTVRTTAFVEPDAIVMHPNDWTDLILSKDSNGQYYAGGPFTGAYGNGPYTNVGRMFGLPVIQTTFCTEGTALVGSFRIGAQIFRRKGITVEATNSEASDFINNRITIRAELRVALAVYKPLAFCEITAIA